MPEQNDELATLVHDHSLMAIGTLGLGHPKQLLAKVEATTLAAIQDHYATRLQAAKLAGAKSLIAETATPYSNEGPDWARGWNSYRNKVIERIAHMKKGSQ